MELPFMLGVEHVAAALNVSPTTVRSQSANGTFVIPAQRIGKQWRYKKTDLAEFLGCSVEEAIGAERQAS